MDTQDKSLKLAELMGWEYGKRSLTIASAWFRGHQIEPYEDTELGLAQFAAILLKYIHLTPSFEQEHDQCGRWQPFEPTQANILDEILRMNGVDITPQRCGVCGTTEDVTWIGGDNPWKCPSPDCVSF